MLTIIITGLLAFGISAYRFRNDCVCWVRAAWIGVATAFIALILLIPSSFLVNSLATLPLERNDTAYDLVSVITIEKEDKLVYRFFYIDEEEIIHFNEVEAKDVSFQLSKNIGPLWVKKTYTIADSWLDYFFFRVWAKKEKTEHHFIMPIGDMDKKNIKQLCGFTK